MMMMMMERRTTMRRKGGEFAALLGNIACNARSSIHSLHYMEMAAPLDLLLPMPVHESQLLMILVHRDTSPRTSHAPRNIVHVCSMPRIPNVVGPNRLAIVVSSYLVLRIIRPMCVAKMRMCVLIRWWIVCIVREFCRRWYHYIDDNIDRTIVY